MAASEEKPVRATSAATRIATRAATPAAGRPPRHPRPNQRLRRKAAKEARGTDLIKTAFDIAAILDREDLYREHFGKHNKRTMHTSRLTAATLVEEARRDVKLIDKRNPVPRSLAQICVRPRIPDADVALGVEYHAESSVLYLAKPNIEATEADILAAEDRAACMLDRCSTSSRFASMTPMHKMLHKETYVAHFLGRPPTSRRRPVPAPVSTEFESHGKSHVSHRTAHDQHWWSEGSDQVLELG